MEDCVIQIKNLNKTFQSKEGRVEALTDINLDVHRGEILGVVGFSGAGKSTLVRCINLLERPESGEVWFGGENLVALKERRLLKVRKKIGMIFQSFNLFDRSTVFENVAYPLRYSGVARAEIEKRVSELLEIVDLQDKRDVYPSQLSGGQKQRVAIARALANNPEVLLSDEATSALDPDATASILQLLKEVNAKLGLTIVLITHEMAVVKAVCNRVAVMEKGRIVERGETREVFSNPQQTITRNFACSTTPLGKIDKLLAEDSELIRTETGVLARLTFRDKNGSLALSAAARRYGVDFRIVLANVEAIGGDSVGGVVTEIRGGEDAVKDAVGYLQANGVLTEVLQNERAD